jgi:YD repeat-containing protein
VGVATTLWSILAASPAAADLTYIYDGLSRLRAVVDPAADTAIYSYDAVGNLLAITRQPSSQVTLIEFPPSGVAGSCGVLLQGTGFDPIAANNTVTVNGVTATVQAATATQITICVPAGATSGPIAVTTPAGSSTSSTAITVAADSGAPTITGLDPIIGTPGTSVTITGSQFDPEPARNNVLFNRVGFAALGTVTSAVIGTTVPLRVGSGPVSVTTSAGTAFSPMDFFVPPAPYGVADVVVMGRMTVGGTSTTVTIPTVNKIGLILFDGDFGQRVSLGVSSVTAQSYVKILNPDGTTLVTSGLITTTEGAVDSPPLPATGTYTAFVDPFGAATGSVTLTLSDEVTGTLTAGGASVVLSINRPGQRARYTFSGTAGQRLSLGVSSVTIPNLYVTIVNPDGTTLITSSQITTTGGAVDPPPLPTTGTYSVLVDPNAAFTGNATLTLSEELTGTLTVNRCCRSRPGQRALLSFTGTTGQRLSLGISSVTIANLYVTISNPDGTTLMVSSQITTTGGTMDLPLLPTTGTYSVLVNPNAAHSGNATLTLSDELTGTLTVNGPSLPLALARVGQNARLTVAGTAGQVVTVRLTSNTAGWVAVTLWKPDGTVLTTSTTWVSAFNLATQTLPTTGTYTVTVNPTGINTGSITVAVTSP